MGLVPAPEAVVLFANQVCVMRGEIPGVPAIQHHRRALPRIIGLDLDNLAKRASWVFVLLCAHAHTLLLGVGDAGQLPRVLGHLLSCPTHLLFTQGAAPVDLLRKARE